MNNKQKRIADATWKRFTAEEELSPQQEQQFEKYCEFLREENLKYNLTAIKDVAGIVRYHFQDSLILRKFVELHGVTTLVDVGTGAGFPAIPLKIMFPDLAILLVEMNSKKQYFLTILAETLGLSGIEIAEYDWRTFLRVTEGDLPLFVSRASLSTRELCRLFRETSPYKNALLVYWASEQWEPEDDTVASHVIARWEYRVGGKKRVLVALQKDPTAQPRVALRMIPNVQS